MTRYDKPSQLFAACLSALAGYVDALGFLQLGGYFASFMSGNSTRMAVGLIGNPGDAAVAGALIGLFVIGVMTGALTAQVAGRHHASAVLALVAILLLAAAANAHAGFPRLAIVGMVLAMGAENAVFHQNGEVAIGLTYMTGTLVKMSQRLVTALTGGDRFAWLPYLMLWLGLIVGAVAGALAYPRTGLEGLWIAGGLAGVLASLSAATRIGSGDRI